MNDQRSSFMNLPLPHPDNGLVVDVMRLRDAISSIDASVEAADGRFSAQDTRMNGLAQTDAALTAAIKKIKTDLLVGLLP